MVEYRQTDRQPSSCQSPLCNPHLCPQHFHVPDVVPELSTEQVLASEWVPGVHIDKVSPQGGGSGRQWSG